MRKDDIEGLVAALTDVFAFLPVEGETFELPKVP